MKRYINLAALVSTLALASCADNGVNGRNSIISSTAEPAGDNCANGGTRIDVGVDANANGTLEAEEIDETIYTCSGIDGDNGEDGSDGSDGEGFITLVDTSDEAPGANCPDGGQRVDYGIDDNADGVLDAAEVDGTAFVCDGPSGLATLVATAAEAAGANCAAGGARIDHGLDDSEDGVLDADEIDGTTFVCNGVDGIDGLQTLVAVSVEAAGANCADGGQRIDQGLDDSEDGVLDAGEIDSTSFVCNGGDGSDGFDSLVSVTAEAAGANCIAGGSRIDSGTDTSDDGVLDAGEITSTGFACNGLQSLVFSSVVGAGGACGTGTGNQLDMGLDLNNDGALQAGEITTTAVVCDGAGGANGADGFEALVSQTAIGAGGACGAATGVQVDSGIDADRNGVLDAGEVADTATLCNGADGANGTPGTDGLLSLVRLTAEPAGANCGDGGTRIDSGLDTDSSGVLEAGEITDTGFACHAVPPDPSILSISGFTLDNCVAVDHNQPGVFDTGDDRGGVALSSSRMFTMSDSGTSSYASLDMTGPVEPVERSDGLISDVTGGRVLSLSTDGATLFPFTAANVDGRAKCDTVFTEVFTSLLELDDNLAVTGTIPLSAPISVSDCRNGMFAGPGFMILMTIDTFFRIDYADGTVTNLGARPAGLNEGPGANGSVCETWAFWGVAEFDGTNTTLLYRQNGTNEMRSNVIGQSTFNVVTDFGAGNPISDLCGFTVDPVNDRWYFHLEGGTVETNSLGNSETSAFCDLAP